MTTNGIMNHSVIVLDIENVMALDELYGVGVTALRFGWQDNVGCWQPYWNYSWTPYDDDNFNCSEGNYSVYSTPSYLPMVPFIFTIDDHGDCLVPFNGSDDTLPQRPSLEEPLYQRIKHKFEPFKLY